MGFCSQCANEGTEICLTCKWPSNNSEPTHFIEKGIFIEKRTPIKKEDEINRPSHYHSNGIDVIGFSEKQFNREELKGFYRINVLKYVTRFDKKGGLKDLKKADFYLEKLMDLEAEHGEK